MDLSYFARGTRPSRRRCAISLRPTLPPRHLRRRVLARRGADPRRHAALACDPDDKGWLRRAMGRRDFGGQAWGPVEAAYLRGRMLPRRCSEGSCPSAVRMLGPVLMEFGTAEQQAEYPARASSTDATGGARAIRNRARARTSAKPSRHRADRDGDDYIVNGQKTWTTLGQYAEPHLLPRAHEKPRASRRRGFRSFLIDLRHAGGIENAAHPPDSRAVTR